VRNSSFAPSSGSRCRVGFEDCHFELQLNLNLSRLRPPTTSVGDGYDHDRVASSKKGRECDHFWDCETVRFGILLAKLSAPNAAKEIVSSLHPSLVMENEPAWRDTLYLPGTCVGRPVVFDRESGA
jgi:hypothetical protein